MIKPRYSGMKALLANIDDSLGTLADRREQIRDEKARLEARIAELDIEEALITTMAITHQDVRQKALIVHSKVVGDG